MAETCSIPAMSKEQMGESKCCTWIKYLEVDKTLSGHDHLQMNVQRKFANRFALESSAQPQVKNK